MLVWLLLAVKISSCPVPVFRYALERWPADPYRMTIFHRGALSAAQSNAVDAARNAGENGVVNLTVSLVDVDGQLDETTKAFWKAQEKPELPWAVVQYPVATSLEQSFEKGTLDAEFMKQLLDSPVRREVCKRILHGDSIVWLVLESGDKKRDDEAVGMLQTEFDKLVQILKIPPVDPNDPRSEVNVTLKIVFSVVRLSRSNPAEKYLVNQLVNIQPSFVDARVPVVFPVFGRGRALCGLTADELTADNVDDVAAFLTGACSCEVKSMNPGVDLLLTADWDGLLEGRVVEEPEMPPLVSLSQLASEARPVVKVGENPVRLVPQPTAARLMRNLIIVIGLCVFAAVVGTIVLRGRDKR